MNLSITNHGHFRRFIFWQQILLRIAVVIVETSQCVLGNSSKPVMAFSELQCCLLLCFLLKQFLALSDHTGQYTGLPSLVLRYNSIMCMIDITKYFCIKRDKKLVKSWHFSQKYMLI